MNLAVDWAEKPQHKQTKLSLMNRLNKIESAIFKLWKLYFQRISFQIIYNLQQSLRNSSKQTHHVFS